MSNRLYCYLVVFLTEFALCFAANFKFWVVGTKPLIKIDSYKRVFCQTKQLLTSDVSKISANEQIEILSALYASKNHKHSFLRPQKQLFLPLSQFFCSFAVHLCFLATKSLKADLKEHIEKFSQNSTSLQKFVAWQFCQDLQKF